MSHLRTSLTFITTTVPKITPVNEGLLTKFYSIRKEQERKMQTMQAIGVDNSYRYRTKSIFKFCASQQITIIRRTFSRHDNLVAVFIKLSRLSRWTKYAAEIKWIQSLKTPDLIFSIPPWTGWLLHLQITTRKLKSFDKMIFSDFIDYFFINYNVQI